MEQIDLTRIATSRRTCKAFDPTRHLDAGTLDALRTVLRYAPSSVNSQPWHFVIAGTGAGKQQLADALQGPYAYNATKIRNASHTVILCRRTDLDEAHLTALLDQEAADGRLPTAEARATLSTTRNHYVALHRNDLGDLATWMEKQVYIALGMLLQAAAALGVDACPMEGFDAAAVDAALGLGQQGLTATVMVALGYGSDADFNAKLPKSRLTDRQIFTEI
jgi:nitroreductase/dihydropteridine reductase